MIRYFCVVAHGPVGDLSREYLAELQGCGRPVRAIPIGPACPEGWGPLARLFVTDLSEPFVNIVCAPPGFLMGGRMSSRDMIPGTGVDPRELDVQDVGKVLAELAHIKVEPGREVIYEPQTALGGIYTVGCKNVAITGIVPRGPDPKEVFALQRYDAIIAPTRADTEGLRALGLDAVHMPSDRSQLRELLDDLCGSVTTVTSPGSPATAAQPTTTSKRSTSTPTTKSKSSRSATAEPSSSRAITSLRGSSGGSFLSRMWRSITRLLARWRPW
jgi:hypothetical protein